MCRRDHSVYVWPNRYQAILNPKADEGGGVCRRLMSRQKKRGGGLFRTCALVSYFRGSPNREIK